MKYLLPLLMKNAVLLLLLCSLPAALSTREVNDLQITSRPGTRSTTAPLDSDSRRHPTAKSTLQQPWNSDPPSIDLSQEDSTSKIHPEKFRDSTRTPEEDSTRRNPFLRKTEDRNEGKEEEEEDEEETLSQTTTVYMPTYFSYGTTRRANSRDRVNANRNFRNNNHELDRNGTSFANGRKSNNVDESSTRSVNNTRREAVDDQKYGRKNSRIVGNSRSNNDETSASSNVRGRGKYEDSRIRENRYEANVGDSTSRRTKFETNSGGYVSTASPPPVTNQPTMTYSSDILKLASPKRSTFGRRVNSTDVEHFTKSPTQLSSSTTADEVSANLKLTTSVESPRGGRILTGRRKANVEESTSTDSDEYLERIQQQIQASTFRPFSTQGYHDVDKSLEYKKKPLKKETEGDALLAGGGGKGGEKLHLKESAKTETQKATEVWDKHLKDTGKMRETLVNMTQKPIVDERYSTIIDTLSKGSGNMPQIIESQKNVTINSEPGTNLLEAESVGSKEANEKRETREKEEDETKSGGDVIPVIVRNSVLGEGVSVDLLNKTVNFRFPSNVKAANDSLFPSTTLETNVGGKPEVVSEKIKDLETNEKITQSKTDVGKYAEVDKDDQEVKKKNYNLKKPLLSPSGGKVDDGFEVMFKNGSSDDVTLSAVPDVTLSAVPSLELNKTDSSRLVEVEGRERGEVDDGTRINELRKTRITSSTSRITSSFSNDKVLSSTAHHEYTTFASNNLENNIITTSSPLLHRFTSTTPRVGNYFSMRTTTTVEAQPATSAGENLIKQISSFNPRKRPAVTLYQTPVPLSSTSYPIGTHSGLESSTESHSTEKISYSSLGHHHSSTSMRSDTIRKIVPWSTRLQKTTVMPDTTTMDYSEETTLSDKTSSFELPDWSRSPPASSNNPAGLPTFSTTYSMPTATFVTSETPSSSSAWTSISYSSRTTSRSLEGISSVTESPDASTGSSTPDYGSGSFAESSESSPASTSSGSSTVSGRLAQSSEPASVNPDSSTGPSRFPESSKPSTSTKPDSSTGSSRYAESPDASVNPGRATMTISEETTVPTSSSSSHSLSITTAESPTSSAVELLENAKSSLHPSKNSSISWGTTTESEYPSSYQEMSNYSSSTISNYPSSKLTGTKDTKSGYNSSTISNYLPSKLTTAWETSDTANDPQRSNKTTVESSLNPSSSSSPLDDLVTKVSDDTLDSTTWPSYGDGNSTEDLQFGDGDGRWRSTTVGLGAEETTGKEIGEEDAITTFRNVVALKSDVNLTSASEMMSTSGVKTPQPYPTSKNALNNSISKQISTSRPLTTSNSHPNTTSIAHPNITSNSHPNTTSIAHPNITSNFHPNVTSNSHPNITSILGGTSTSKPQEPEDMFETDEEELMHTTSTLPSTEVSEYEEEDDRTMAQTTAQPKNNDNRIVQNGSGEEMMTTERDNFIMKISTTESPLWTTDSEEGATTPGRTAPSRGDDAASTTTPSSINTQKPTPMQKPIKPVTIEPDLTTTNPQYMGLSLLIKGSTLQEICHAQPSLKSAIIFLFRNTTGRVLHEDQIVFPSLTADDCNGGKSLKSGFHNVDLMLLDENGNFDDELGNEFRMLWENHGLRTNIAIHDVYLILRPSEEVQTSGMTIAVIVIACIGLTCLLLFFILMMILRKRQKKFNYGQRCTPVSLDDYSLDNISVYNSIRRKNARRASKRSYGNPAFDDPSAPSHPMNFAALAHFTSQRAAIDDEFDDIPKLTAKMDELPPGAETRNRYANVIPLPETRVTLAARDGDDPAASYINANYVKGPKGAPKFYIACQAPMQSTVNDFWRMIWEQQSKLVLMLTDLYENGVEKCFDYLPPSEVLDCHRLFGDYQVTLKKREVREKYVISHLQLKNLDSNLWREVTHLWYSSWPHRGTPSEGNSIIAYLIEARAFMRNSSGPHVVHCSPGVGRTGTVLAIDLCIREFETSRMVDVPKTVYALRRDRAGCVQTKDQYAFIYMVLNVYGTKLTGGALDSM